MEGKLRQSMWDLAFFLIPSIAPLLKHPKTLRNPPVRSEGTQGI